MEFERDAGFLECEAVIEGAFDTDRVIGSNGDEGGGGFLGDGEFRRELAGVLVFKQVGGVDEHTEVGTGGEFVGFIDGFIGGGVTVVA